MAAKNTRIHEFVERWSDPETFKDKNEKQLTQLFWVELLRDVAGLSGEEVTRGIEFEHRTAGGGFIDVFYKNYNFLAEQKSQGIDLDKPETRQSTQVTPAQQALRYANELPTADKPTFICTSNFSTLRFYSLNDDPTLKNSPYAELTLPELENQVGVLRSIFSEENSETAVQQHVSEQAGLLVAHLHNALAEHYQNPDDPGEHHALAMLTIRIVFCLYAEDAGLFDPDIFTKLVRGSDSIHLRAAILQLFETLNTRIAERDPYLEEEFAKFPYVNGGLFAEKIPVPPMDDAIRDAIGSAGSNFDWSEISPVIFGSLMEETLSHDQRRAGGMHYTSVKNIHRLIDPLFLDELTKELEEIERDSELNERARDKKLHAYQDKLSHLKFLDPACGSGNFLTETFLCLRKLENRAIAGYMHGVGQFDFGDNSEQGGPSSVVKVHIDQMFGIEINDFAAQVAKTALWIAEQQALDDTEEIFGNTLNRLPLHDSGTILCANALRADWNELLPASECSYVMGNPPFIGHISKTPEQTEDLKTVWGKGYDGYLDYVTGWYKKTADYLTENHNSEFAFVSTNSITQGLPVPALFKPLFAAGWRIAFAHRTFAWNAQSTDMAHVHVVIIGFSRDSRTAKSGVPSELPDKSAELYTYERLDSEFAVQCVPNINPYLIAADNIFIEKRTKPLSELLSKVSFGTMPIDGGNLIIEPDQYEEAMADPIAKQYIRPFRMGYEFIHRVDRWCLWLEDASGDDIQKSSFIRKRVQACKAYREASPKGGDAYKYRETPHLFRANASRPTHDYLAIPRIFSQNRTWSTCDYYSSTIIAADSLFTCNDPNGFNFSIIESSVFMTWLKSVSGRLKSDFRFSQSLIWNNLPLPPISDELRQHIINVGKAILEVRAKYPDESLASLYNPLAMHPDLIKAHQALDVYVDQAFGASPVEAHTLTHAPDDVVTSTRLSLLFARYKELTSKE